MDNLDSISAAWCHTLLSEHIAMYDEMLLSGDPEKVVPEYAGATAIYQSLDREGQVALLQLLKVVSVDTASQLLGNLDGSSYISGIEADFSVKYDGVDVTGYLQDSFLGTVEDEGYFPKRRLEL
ncbi:hypothetical protein [Stenotrophomonas sp.]|uniref:hypothetical protein n=1 Tax=Stenotrophomonas sp. TaxID=69392 RepID=UPI0028A0F2CD|nr:hypothetical protein [Stenotrophomonas sp.]